MEENFWPTFWVGLALVVVIVVGVFLVRAVESPSVQSGYNQNLSTLVADYCSAPQLLDQRAIRQKIIAAKDGNPSAYAVIPSNLHDDVENVIGNNYNAACHF